MIKFFKHSTKFFNYEVSCFGESSFQSQSKLTQLTSLYKLLHHQILALHSAENQFYLLFSHNHHLPIWTTHFEMYSQGKLSHSLVWTFHLQSALTFVLNHIPLLVISIRTNLGPQSSWPIPAAKPLSYIQAACHQPNLSRLFFLQCSPASSVTPSTRGKLEIVCLLNKWSLIIHEKSWQFNSSRCNSQ